MKPATTLGMLIFLAMTAVHIMRLFTKWTVVVNGMTVPIWVSGVAAVILGLLVVLMFLEQRPRTA